MPKTAVVFRIALILLFAISNLSKAQNINQETTVLLEEYKNKANEFKSANNPTQQASYLNKIAYLYWENNAYTEAINYFKESLLINKQANNHNGTKAILYNIGLIYSDLEDYKKAYDNFHEGLTYARKLNQKEGIYAGLINEAGALKNLSKNTEAIKAVDEALLLAQELNDLKLIRTSYGMLAENYEALGNAEKAMEYYALFASVDKHIKSEQIKDIESKSKEEIQRATQAKSASDKQLSEKVSELEETQESLKKTEELTKQQQLELDLKELTIREKENQLKSERIIRFSFAAIALIILLFSLVLIRQIRSKNKINAELAAKNKQIQDQSLEIAAQRDLANKQKQNMTDSIEYAKRIQTALLPPAGFLRRSLPEHFILYKPRDIVSGDFYWLMNKDSKIIIAAADCTGHGVPGAFMSMLGTAFLNEIVNKIVENKHVYSLQANEILNQLRTYIIESLHQTGRTDETKDGIDIALCILDYDTKQLQFAGAHSPLYHITQGELKIYKGDPMPASIHQNAEISFTNNEITVSEGDVIYLFTDGYHDQIGGPRKRKFMSRAFQELLLKIHQKPMDAQKQILDETIEDWKGSVMQIDDMLVIGLKLEFDKVIKHSSSQHYNWNDKTILIADDIDINYIFLVEALKNTGAQTVRAKNGQEAIDIVKSGKQIDLILMDINMPLLNGFETTTIIKSINKNIPVIAQTAMNMEDAREKSQQAGCDDYILKPIRLKAFLSMLESYLNKKE
ncbi:MAG: response regulator [Bacteroidales bacterium]